MKAVSSFDDYVVLFYHMRLSLLYLKEKMKWNPPSLDGGLNLGLFSVSNKWEITVIRKPTEIFWMQMQEGKNYRFCLVRLGPTAALLLPRFEQIPSMCCASVSLSLKWNSLLLCDCCEHQIHRCTRLSSPQYKICAQELSLALTLSGIELRIAQRWWVVDVESKTTWDNKLKGFTVDSASLCSLNQGGLSRPRKKEKYLVFLFEDDQTQLFDYDFSVQVLEVL